MCLMMVFYNVLQFLMISSPVLQKADTFPLKFYEKIILLSLLGNREEIPSYTVQVYSL